MVGRSGRNAVYPKTRENLGIYRSRSHFLYWLLVLFFPHTRDIVVHFSCVWNLRPTISNCGVQQRRNDGVYDWNHLPCI